MDSNKIKTIQRFTSGSASENDLKNLFYWLNSKKGNSEIHQSLDEYWNLLAEGDRLPVDSDKILTNIRNGIKYNRPIRLIAKKLLPYAAILIILLSLGGILVKYFNNQSITNDRTFTSVIVDNGQRSKVILPDSSVVWLNSGTTLSYSSDFAQGSREIYLNGQAFFDITRNERVPLFVHCNDLLVKVLGTKFDVSAYSENNRIRVVLESGSVQLTSERVKNCTYQLKPGEMADYDREKNKMITGKADLEKFTSWRNGILIFRNDPLKLIIEKLERWYNIEIEIADPAVYSSIFTGTIRNESYEQILKLIEYSCSVSFRINDDNTSGSIPHFKVTKKSMPMTN